MRRPAMHDALPLGQWVSQFLNFVLAHDNGTLENLGKVIGAFAEAIEAVLVALPDWAVAGAISAIGLWRVGWAFRWASGWPAATASRPWCGRCSTSCRRCPRSST